ncbi:RNA-binding KH domain-containing protein [Raphanus sativus]|uniref:RNA-binding KH domain-containing protein RCF3-like n=1 Tax=Raphanus sativus TaxID=3726 RepID=A0A6J0KZV4_RAPSA|nr:RNA-binding KH domain-containing protein RCF3-like [Raphanus sativus]KAJ4875719.1 RNA-binding KH domain-containing protein [Raphanus sativus]
MERSRSKRNYHYDQDYDGGDSIPRSKPRYNNHFGGGGNNRYRGGGNGRPSKSHSDTMATTTYRVLCHDAKAGGVIGKSGSIIKSIRQHTGAWINVHELVPGDAERIIEISDNRRRDPDGRMPAFSPAQEALFSVHDRILESEAQYGYGVAPPPEDEEDYGGVRPGGGKVVTRLVVSKVNVGCLLGRGGKIIEQMRIETKTHIRILPRETNLPRCVSLADEIVQIVGEAAAVRNALGIVASRLRESQHRDRSQHLLGRVHSPERSFSPAADDYIPQQRRLSTDRYRNNNGFGSRQSNYPDEAPAVSGGENLQQPFYTEELVFKILCPVDKIVKVVGESQGIVELLQNDVGVDMSVSDPVAGSDEQIITISSEEAPDDPLFPAQEALLHIQTQIVDLIPDKDNLITTKLLVSSRDSVCLEGKAGSVSEISRLTGASVQILAREEIPQCVSINDVVVQIAGEIRAARDALVELTLRLRSQMCKELSQKETPPGSTSTTGPLEGVAGVMEVASSNNTTQSREGLAIAPQYKESGGFVAKGGESEHRDEVPVTASRMSVALVTRSTLEIVLPDEVIPKLVTKSRNKLAQVSEWSGASVTLVEDRPEETQNVIRISGTPEQAGRAQSLLQGFILSIQDDGP